jgi:ERCC4-type nuclease
MTRRIVIDTREQRPYSFEGSVRKALPSGDYSIEGLESCFAIERKSLDDWVNTVLRSRSRFTRELIRLRDYEFAAIVIEGSVADILQGNYKSEVKPDALLGITAGIMQSFSPVHVLFAGDRPHAYALVTKLLELGEKKYGNTN